MADLQAWKVKPFRACINSHSSEFWPPSTWKGSDIINLSPKDWLVSLRNSDISISIDLSYWHPGHRGEAVVRYPKKNKKKKLIMVYSSIASTCYLDSLFIDSLSKF